jgi:hypothetical protein
MNAAYGGYDATVRLLLDGGGGGADINIQDNVRMGGKGRKGGREVIGVG